MSPLTYRLAAIAAFALAFGFAVLDWLTPSLAASLACLWATWRGFRI